MSYLSLISWMSCSRSVMRLFCALPESTACNNSCGYTYLRFSCQRTLSSQQFLVTFPSTCKFVFKILLSRVFKAFLLLLRVNMIIKAFQSIFQLLIGSWKDSTTPSRTTVDDKQTWQLLNV